MAYTAIFLKNRAELKMRLGSSTGETIAFIMGLDFPPDEAFSVYEWNITSTAAFNDTDIVAPTIRETGQGRWFRRNIRELDPTVHSWVKSITQEDVTQWRQAYQVTSTLPTTFPPSSHTHPITDVVGLTAELSDKLEVESDPTVPTWVKSITQANINSWNNPPTQTNADWTSTSGASQILNKPSSFPPSVHTHAQSDITGFSTALSGKANVSHTHPISDVTGLQTALDGKISTGAPIPYSTLTGTPTVPTNTSQLTNGANFITSSGAPVQSVNGQTGSVVLNIPSAQIQSDWNQTTTTALDFIKNKPTIPTVNYPVTSVNTKTGAVVLTKADVGLGNVDNTSDANKPISTATQTALNAKLTGTNIPFTKVRYYTVTSDATSVWTVNLGNEFTTIVDVQVTAVSTANTIAGVRQASLNAWTGTSTTLSGLTFGSNTVPVVLIAAVQALSLASGTVVRVTVYGT